MNINGVEILFTIGQMVYLVSDKDQQPRIVTGLMVNPKDIMYRLVQGSHESYHYDIEISAEKNILTSIT